MKIFDGYNIIGKAGGLGLSLAQEDKEERLLRILSAYRSRRRSRQRYLVVFDGNYGSLARGPRKRARGGITVEWAVGESADALIVRRVKRSANPRQIEVVTSDGEILRQVRLSRARGVRSEAFLGDLKRALEEGPALEKPQQLSEQEVEEWLELFGGEE